MDKARKILTLLFALAIPAFAVAAGNVKLEPAGNDVDNVVSLQRGARNFMNYCSGCHSAQYVRFNSVARGLNLSEDQVVENLMFNAQKTFETIRAAMPPEDAKRWFGQSPPDLSLMARAKGTDYIFNFLKGFYRDPDSPTGVDNIVLAGTSMPHVLWELQGLQNAEFAADEHGSMVFQKFDLISPGLLSPEEFDSFVRDTVNFMEYIAEPVRSTRRKLGVWVLMFLTVFLVIASMLKKQIWKDVS
jgi:ubiquinol-cytochrome c reductase cytochrome c1 subunit